MTDQSPIRIGVITASVREGRLADPVAEWVYEKASARDDFEAVLIDLRSFDVPILTSATVPMAAQKKYDDPRVTAWGEAIDGCDAYVVVTPEYNHSIPGALKNAIDSLGPEWVGKAIGFVAYGADGGVRCVEHLRTVMANFSMVAVRGQVSLSLFGDFADGKFTPQDRRAGELAGVFDQVSAMARKLQVSVD